jgi:threonine dehydrogenase-like Zn-dependent dehydrogenase
LEYGADLAFNPIETNVVEEVVNMTDGYGCDVYIEATGHPNSVSQGLEMIRKMGTFVEFSVFKDLVTVDWSIISDRKELDVLGAHLSPYCYEPVIEWMENNLIPTEGVVTHVLPLTEWEKAFEMAEKGDNSLKIVLKP